MVRINTILSEDIVEKLDNIAKDEKKSRSMLLRKAAEKLIEEYQHRLEEKHKRERIKHAIEVQDRLRKKSGKWNGVSEIRKWREASR
ncbi:MAG: ribbon-helix-helix protein, CopG family [Nitrospirota bacterium]